MQLVVEISEDSFFDLKKKQNRTEVDNAVLNGTPLPKGHGALKDSDLLDKRLNFVLNNTGGYKNTPTGTGIVIAMAENLDAPTVLDAEAESD